HVSIKIIPEHHLEDPNNRAPIWNLWKLAKSAAFLSKDRLEGGNEGVIGGQCGEAVRQARCPAENCREERWQASKIISELGQGNLRSKVSSRMGSLIIGKAVRYHLGEVFSEDLALHASQALQGA
ncbi:MAG: hypothetical protein ACK56F_26930, partial [bacterium]